MARRKESSKKYIVSCRVDDYEMSLLKQRANSEGVSITQLLRSCLDFNESKPRRQGYYNSSQAC